MTACSDFGAISPAALARMLLALIPAAPAMLRASPKVLALHADSRQRRTVCWGT